MNLCILASGYGSNLNSVIISQKKGKIQSKVVLVVSNNSKSNALNIARVNQIPAFHLSEKLYNSREEFVQNFLQILKKHEIDLIVLAGYMKLLPVEVIKAFKNRIINIHPALIPAFCGKGYYGMNVHQAVIESGVKITGVTIHIVDEVYDHGPILIQRPIAVLDDDTAESLQKRVLKIEHKLLPKVIKLMESKHIQIIGRRVIFQ